MTYTVFSTITTWPERCLLSLIGQSFNKHLVGIAEGHSKGTQKPENICLWLCSPKYSRHNSLIIKSTKHVYVSFCKTYLTTSRHGCTKENTMILKLTNCTFLRACCPPLRKQRRMISVCGGKLVSSSSSSTNVSKGKEPYLMQRTPELVCNQPNDGTIKQQKPQKNIKYCSSPPWEKKNLQWKYYHKCQGKKWILHHHFISVPSYLVQCVKL